MIGELPIRHHQRLWLYALVVLVLAFLMLPVLIVLPISFSDSQLLQFPPKGFSLRWYEHFFDSPGWLAATRVSLTAAVMTVLLATPIGTLAAYTLHASRSRWTMTLNVIILLPQVVPLILVGIGIFYLYIQLGLVNTLTGIVIAHTLLAIPFVVVTVLSGLKGYDMSLERAARSLGASWPRAFVSITLPQIRRSVLSGAFFAFITSLDEVVIGLFIAGGDNTVLTRRMFLSLRDQIDPTIAAISSMLIAVSIVALTIAIIMAGRNRPE